MTTKQINTEEPFILAVISGKGGVGKSMAGVNTAEMLHHMGYRVALIDADIGLSNCSTLLNETVEASVAQWINGECILEEVPQQCGGITLVTGSDEPGLHQLQPELMMDALDQVVLYLSPGHDFIIIDTPAGAGEMTLWALDRAHTGTIVLVDEPTAISDVYRLCKYVYGIDPGYHFTSIVNYAENEESAESTARRFNNILDYFLQKQTVYFGFIPASKTIRETVQAQTTLLRADTENQILKEFQFISENIIGLSKKRLESFSNQAL